MEKNLWLLEKKYMIKIIDRYLGTTVLRATALVLLMLAGISIFIMLVKEMGSMGRGVYGLIGAIEYVFLDFPKQIYLLFPMACLLGTLLGLGTLASNSELIILRASSMSISKIIWAVMKTMVIILIAATLIGEVLAPAAEHKAEARKSFLLSNGQALKTSKGTWIRDGQNFLYIRQSLGSKLLEGVSRYQFDNNNKLLSASYAERGYYQEGHWMMQNVVESIITSTQIQTRKIPQEIWPLSLNPKLLRISEVNPAQMSLKQLNDYILYLKKNNQNTSTYSLSFWQRILQPLATLVMVWLAIPFVFGPLRRATMGLRIVLGAAVGFCFITLNQFFGPMSMVYQLPPFIAAILPIILFSIAAWILQKRVI
jgi:lipopolysaccharide export system permease protein